MPQPTPPTPEVLVAVDRVATELRSLLAALGAPSAADIAAVESVGRLMDAARIRACAPLSRSPLAAEKLGYASAVAAVASIAQISERSARARLAVAAAVSADLSISGAPLPAAHPQLATALEAGDVGIDAASLITRELDAVAPRVDPEVLTTAETLMVNLACGLDPSGARSMLPVSVDFLSGEIRQIAGTIDPDGALPRETRAKRRRAFRIGTQDDDGLFPVSGRLVPETALLLAGLIEALRRSPRFASVDELDDSVGVGDSVGRAADDGRTPDQRRHDAFAEILMGAASSEDTPRLDGHPVSVIVSVEAEQFDNPEGLAGDPIGVMSGSRFPLSRAEVDRYVDDGGMRLVRTSQGRVTGVTSLQRCFTPSQRLAIAARDGNRCFTPGCTSPHYTLQAHHVVAYRDRGPTVVDNGILLCYWHHRIVDTGPWQYRMVNGMPEVRGPGVLEWVRPRPWARVAA